MPDPLIEDFFARYAALLAEGVAPPPLPTGPPGRRGRVKRTPDYNPIARLREHRDAVFRFLTDLGVPFDNNRAELDIRMPKLKQKVYGGFRCAQGAQAFPTVRSHLSTLREESIDSYCALP